MKRQDATILEGERSHVIKFFLSICLSFYATCALASTINAAWGPSEDPTLLISHTVPYGYNARYEETFSSDAKKDAGETTLNWDTDYGSLQLDRSEEKAACSYDTSDLSSYLSNFTGPVKGFANGNNAPIFYGDGSSLNWILPVNDSRFDDFGPRIVGFSTADITAVGWGIRGDVMAYMETIDQDESAEEFDIGDENNHYYILVAGDDSRGVRLNKIKIFSISNIGEGTVTETDNLSSELSLLGFAAVNDIACSDKGTCLIAGPAGKLVEYDGNSFTDLSGELDLDADNIQVGFVSDTFLVMGSEYSSSKYIGKVYEYDGSDFTKVSTDSLFTSYKTDGYFGMSADSSGRWLIIYSGDSIKAYIYDGDDFDNVSSEIKQFYYVGDFIPNIHNARSVWYVTNKKSAGAVVRFDGEEAVDIKDSLGVDAPIYAVGSIGTDFGFIIAGGKAGSPELHAAVEVNISSAYPYKLSGVAKSLKTSSVSQDIESATLEAVSYIPVGTSVTYYLSSDGGSHWKEAVPGEEVEFDYAGNDLRWKIDMKTNDSLVSPKVYSLSVSFSLEGYTVTDDFDDGYLVKDESTSKVYIIMGNRKRWIVSTEEFSVMGYDWSDIKTVNRSLLSNIAEVRLVRAVGTDSIYYITNLGMKRLILNSEVFNSYGNKYEDVVDVDQKIVNLYPEVEFIKDANGKIYRISNGEKKWISSPEEFAAAGGDWSEVAPVNDTELAAYEEVGTTFSSHIVDGDIVRAVGNPDVYIIKIVGNKKFRRLVLTPKVFDSYGHLKWENIKEVSAATLGEFTDSALVTTCSPSARGSFCEAYQLQASGDSGTKKMIGYCSSDRISFDLDSIYTVNRTDFDSYQTTY